MRDVVTGIETQVRATTAPGSSDNRAHMLAVYGAFALIAAIVFGTLSFHPF